MVQRERQAASGRPSLLYPVLSPLGLLRPVLDFSAWRLGILYGGEVKRVERGRSKVKIEKVVLVGPAISNLPCEACS